MKPLLTAILLLSSWMALAQKPKITKTDSSRIEARIYPGGKEVKEILKAKDLVYYRFYRDNKAIVTTTSTYTKAGRVIGITKEYNDQGKLLYKIDHDRGSWWPANRSAYQFYEIQNRMKLKADTYISAIYGQKFLTNNAIWNVQTSAIYNATESGDWTDHFAEKPTKFLFRYDVKLDSKHVYPELIELELDANGNFIPNESEEVFGFEKRPTISTNGFALVYNTAIEIVKKKSGLSNQQLTGFLKWESFKKASLYNGQFRFYVTVKTGSVKDIHPKGRSSVTDKFDVYSFNPWTGNFIEKKKMKSIRSWEELSGNSTGLIPDK